MLVPFLAAVFGSPYDSDVAAWVAAVRAAGGKVSNAQRQRTTTLVRGLKSDGTWPLLDRLWLFAAENSTQARRDLVGRTAATPQNGPTFTANRGYTGDGLSTYIDLNFNPSTGGVHYTRNDASYGVWVGAANTVPSARLIGYDGFVDTELRYNAGANYSIGINSGSYTATGISVASLGLFVATRVGASGAGSQNSYYNGGSLVADNQVSTALPNQNFFALASNQAGGAIVPTDAREAGAFIGASLTAAQVASLYTRLRTYMTAVGVP